MWKLLYWGYAEWFLMNVLKHELISQVIGCQKFPETGTCIRSEYCCFYFYFVQQNNLEKIVFLMRNTKLSISKHWKWPRNHILKHFLVCMLYSITYLNNLHYTREVLAPMDNKEIMRGDTIFLALFILILFISYGYFKFNVIYPILGDSLDQEESMWF